ncbi:MAG TPA: helical backbone metal receptor [Candidatus Wallbacteria bacterium]|nr:helical backbone metal receptor [Candidatus Wallbacteria bacterium]
MKYDMNILSTVAVKKGFGDCIRDAAVAESSSKNSQLRAGVIAHLFLFCAVGIAMLFTPGFLFAGSDTTEVTDTTEIFDAAGKKFDVTTAPISVISTAPAITEIIFYLGGAEKLKGVTSFCDYPAEAKKIEKVGDLNLNYEKIIELKPDIVFIMKGLRPKESEVLESFGIKAFTIELNSMRSIFESMDLIAGVLKTKKNSSELKAAYKNLRKHVKSRHEKSLRSVYFEVWGEPPMSVGSASFINDIIKKAGAINIFGNVDVENISVSFEKVIEKNPEFIVIAYPGKTLEVSLRPGFENLIAVKDGNVIEVDYNLYVRPGPRVVKGILDLHNKLYSDTPIPESEVFSK